MILQLHPLAIALCLLGGCATPRVIWAGQDRARLSRVEVIATDTEQWLRTGEVQGARFDAIGTDGIVFATEGNRVVYPAVRGGKWFVIAGAEKLGPYEGIADVRVSRDGARIAFAAQTRAGWRPVVDGVAGPVFEHYQGGTLQFSENGFHVAFTGSNGPCAYLVVDDIPGPCRERVVSMRVTDAGTVAAVIKRDDKEHFVLQPEARPVELGAPPDALGEWAVTSDGRRFAYAARLGTRWSAIVDGIPSVPCASVHHLRFGDQGRRIAWVCRDAGLASVVIDGAAGKPFLAVSPPILAARAPDFAYIAHDGMGEWVVADDSMSGPFAEVLQLVVPKGGGPAAFIARTDGILRVVHRDLQTPFPMIVDGSLVLTDDGGHWAVIAGDPLKRELWLIVDGSRVRKVAPAEVFGERDPLLAPWLERELHDEVGARVAASTRSVP